MMLATFLVIGCTDNICPVSLNLLLDPLIKHHVLVNHPIVFVIDQVMWLVLHLVVLSLIIKLIIIALLVIAHTLLILSHLRLALS